MKELQELRDKWENPDDKITTINLMDHPKSGAFIVIAKSNDTYTALRYFKLGDNWHVSVDEAHISADSILQYVSQLTGE